MVSRYLLAIFGTALVLACSKDAEKPEPGLFQWAIAVPLDSTKINAGDTLFIQAQLSVENGPVDYSISVREAQYDTLVANILDEFSFEKTVEVETFWISQAKGHADYHLVFNADKQKGQIIEKRIPFHVHPLDGH
ncbi:hypothetical protein [Luteibaculum oceani]|uniref:DUF4625 domain-containing protein n=1 Tax=Luteibaculum oceani TaxID=1294296 RepID=A0A5C6VI95_9FLAO|nr:hypothetical protein [Luteibaculum oceani]TXC85212.1 hypothetical protein FRX97_00900 [Luteibaculum oceani]